MPLLTPSASFSPPPSCDEFAPSAPSTVSSSLPEIPALSAPQLQASLQPQEPGQVSLLLLVETPIVFWSDEEGARAPVPVAAAGFFCGL